MNKVESTEENLEKTSIQYYPVCINADDSTGHFFSQDTFDEALSYLKRRSKGLVKPDKEQWIEKRVETVTRYEVL